MTGKPIVLALAVVSLALLTACDGGTPQGNLATAITPSGTPPAQPSSTVNPATLAPRVKNPLLDAGRFALDPCKSLTAAQQNQFGLDNGRIDSAVEGPSCFFRKISDRHNITAVVYASKIKGGLSSRYYEHERGFWNYWEPTTVDGYPAVGFVASDSANPDPKACHFAIGVTDTLYFWVTADDNPGAAKCAASREVASAVLATIKTGR